MVRVPPSPHTPPPVSPGRWRFPARFGDLPARCLPILLLCIGLSLGGCLITPPPDGRGGLEPLAGELDDSGSNLSQTHPDWQPLLEDGVVDFPPMDPDSLLNRAQELENNGDIEAAANYFRQFLKQHPEAEAVPGVLVSLGRIHLNKKETGEATIFLNGARRYPDHPAADWSLLFLGEVALAEGNLENAWQRWSQLLNRPPPLSEKAWEKLLVSYFSRAMAENGAAFAGYLPPSPFGQQRVRTLMQIAGERDRERLRELAALQPVNGALSPFIDLALGDQLARAGEEEAARASWERARESGATLGEAERRLSGTIGGESTRIGLLLPLSGRWSKLGNHLLQSAQKALADYRDIPLTLIIGDSGGEAATAVTAFSNLVNQGVEAVVGPVFHEPSLAVARAAVQHRMPLFVLNPRSSILEAGPWVFLNAFHPGRQARIMARYAIEVEKRLRFAILAPDSDYGRTVTEAFTDEVLKLGGKVVRVAHFPANIPDFSPWIKALTHLDAQDVPERMKTAGRAHLLDPTDPPAPTNTRNLEPWADFDALFLPAKAHEVRLIAPQAAFYNINIRQVKLLGVSLWNRPELLEEGTDYLNGAVFSDTDQEKSEHFRTTFQQAWGIKPTPLAMLTYDGIGILAQLFREERLGGMPWYQGLTREQPFQGAAGPVRFLHDGRSQRPYHLFKVGEGKVSYLAPEPEPPPLETPPRVLPPPGGAPPAPTLEEMDDGGGSVLDGLMGAQPDAAMDGGRYPDDNREMDDGFWSSDGEEPFNPVPGQR